MEERNELVETNKEGLLSTESEFFNNNNKKMFTTLDLEDENQNNMLLNALDNVDYKLNEVVDKEIECVGIYATETDVQNIDPDTGEVITRKKHVLMLFDKEGKSYVTGSNACYNSFKTIYAFKKRLPSINSPMILKAVKVPAKQQGHSYLRLKYIR